MLGARTMLSSACRAGPCGGRWKHRRPRRDALSSSLKRGITGEPPEKRAWKGCETMVDIRLVKEMREDMIREVEANRVAKSLRKKGRRRESLAASFAKELRLDFARLASIFRSPEIPANRKGRP
jgi:hypothetical protein